MAVFSQMTELKLHGGRTATNMFTAKNASKMTMKKPQYHAIDEEMP
jgi:hypothetical protein